MPSSFYLLDLAIILLTATVSAQSTGSGSCTDVHIFIARGWNEPYPGRQGTLVTDICNDLSDSSCDYEDVVFDAASTDYCPSVLTAETNGLAQINAYYAKCPDTALVLSGYSEGANVVSDILAGGSCGTFSGLQQSSGASCNIAAALLFGDPHHMPDQPYNVLDGSAGQGEGGVRTDEQVQALDSYTGRLRSYCQYDDLVCATGLGADTVEAHTNYFELYSEDAASWVADLVQAFSPSQYCASASSSSSTASTLATSTSTSNAAISSVATFSTTASSTSSSLVSSSTPSDGASSSVAPVSSAVAVISTSSGTVAYSTATVATYTLTGLVTMYTTLCSVTSAVNANGTTSTSIWTTASTFSSNITSAPASTTTIDGKPAVVKYSTKVTATTLWNYPTITMTKQYPVATSYFGSTGWSNGTAATGAASSSASNYSSAPTTGAEAPAYTGAASSVKVASVLAGAAGLAVMLML